jgi:hypothetical protein
MKHLCVKCHDSVVPQARRQLGYLTCMSCGETAASKVRHTIAPMHKGNYMLFTDLNDLKGINNKGGLHR